MWKEKKVEEKTRGKEEGVKIEERGGKKRKIKENQRKIRKKLK